MTRPANTVSRDRKAAREAILQAALQEFAHEGMAGARTEAIARAARVNKALLYYYFKDKESLYGAALDHVFGGLAARLQQVLNTDLPPREKILAYLGAHFDAVAASPIFPRVIMREMMRAGRNPSPHLKRIAKRYFRPLQLRLMALIQEGIAAGEFRPVNAPHFVMSMIALVVFYFGATRMIGSLTGGNPLSPPRVAERRAAVLDIVSAALFRNYQAPPREARP